MEKSIAFFDFDGTITKKDTMLELARFSRGAIPFWIGLGLVSPWLVAMKLGFISRSRAKEKLLTHFFGGTLLESFNHHCILFTQQVIPGLVRKDAMIAIQNHQEQNTPVVVVSASAENWVAPWCIQHNLQFVCTRLEVIENKITGKLKGENCNGYEKVKRIKQVYNLADYSVIYCYGDTRSDEMMLQLGTHPHYKVFKD